MTTNGYLLTPDIAEKLMSWGILRYQITMDGAPEDHNRNHPGRSGEPTFDVIFQNLLALRERPEDFHIDLRINFDPQNRVRLKGFIDLLGESFGADPLFKLRLRAVGRWAEPTTRTLRSVARTRPETLPMS